MMVPLITAIGTARTENEGLVDEFALFRKGVAMFEPKLRWNDAHRSCRCCS